jgi:hypothetical protein
MFDDFNNNCIQVNIKDHAGRVRIFDLTKKIEILHGLSSTSKVVNIERIDLKSKSMNPIVSVRKRLCLTIEHDTQSIQMPSHWTPMTSAWTRLLLGKRENINEWSMFTDRFPSKLDSFGFFEESNVEIQNLLKLPHMLPESWVNEVRTMSIFTC